MKPPSASLPQVGKRASASPAGGLAADVGPPKRRRRAVVIQVQLTAEQKADIEARAAGTGMSASAYLRALGLGYQPIGRLDAAAAKDLLKAAISINRLGNLLALWLKTPEKQVGRSHRELVAWIESARRRIDANQAEIRTIVGRVTRDLIASSQ